MAGGTLQGGVLKEYGWTIVGAIVVALCIRFFLIEAYRIPGYTMKPTLESGDTVFVGKWKYRSQVLPERGEVVVYSLPGDPGRNSIRRVVGLPGDVVGFQDGAVTVNGKSTREAVTKDGVFCAFENLGSSAGDNGARYQTCWERPLIENMEPTKVPEGQVLVVGDFRVQWTDLSKKHKNWHMVPLNAIKAQALWTWLSVEPKPSGAPGSWFSRIRFERMFQKIQ